MARFSDEPEAFGGTESAAPEGREEHSRAAKPPDRSPKIIRSPGGAARSGLAPAATSRSGRPCCGTNFIHRNLDRCRPLSSTESVQGRGFRTGCGSGSSRPSGPARRILGGGPWAPPHGYALLSPPGVKSVIRCRRPNTRRRRSSARQAPADIRGLTRAVDAFLKSEFIPDTRLLPNLHISA